MLIGAWLFGKHTTAEAQDAPAKAIPVEEEDSSAPAKPLPLRTPLTTFGGVNWVNKQIKRNINGAVQTGFNLPLSDIPGLGARVSGRYELQRLGAHFRRSDQISWTLSYGAGFNPAGAALNAAGATVPLSVSAGVSRTHSSIFTRQSPDYWDMALDGVYLPTSIPRSSEDLDTIEIGTMLSIPVQTSFGPGIGMEKVMPLFGRALGDLIKHCCFFTRLGIRFCNPLTIHNFFSNGFIRQTF